MLLRVMKWPDRLLLTDMAMIFFTACLLLPSPSFAISVSSYPNAQAMLQSIAIMIPDLIRLATAIAYVLGLLFVIRGIIKLKHMGESRTMMSREHNLNVPLMLIFIGALLLYLPSTVQTGMSTFWTDPNPYAYKEEYSQWAEVLNAVYLVVQLVGIIAFIRGLVMLTQAEGGHGNRMGKAFTHIIAGILCINIYGFVQAVMATLGLKIVA